MENNSHCDLDHRHIIVTAFVSNPPLTVEIGENWLHELVDIVDMKILMNASAIYCEDLGNEGVTGVVGLTTSHASFHSWHDCEKPFVQMDLYSCRHFEIEDVLNHMLKFGAYEIDYVLIDRNLKANNPIQRVNRTYNKETNIWE